MAEDVICAVPGCNNELTEEQKNKKISVCSNCEAAKMHICEACGKKISTNRVRNGATLCNECEMNPMDMEEAGTKMMEYEEDYNTGEEEEDFMV